MTTFTDELSAAMLDAIKLKYNENHDALGRFTFSGGGESSPMGAGWYHKDMSDSALHGILTSNHFQAGEINAHGYFKNRINKLGLKIQRVPKTPHVLYQYVKK